jgi:DNA polymerase III alpha subunit
MKIDNIGQTYHTADDLVNILYSKPDVNLSKFLVEDPAGYNSSVELTYSDFDTLLKYQPFVGSIEEFNAHNQSQWHMPEEYRSMDIAKWVLDQCRTQEELQRVGEELILYQERNLFDLLRQLKYVVDTWRKNNIVWGVGRGSSVASYVLYLIGVHRINSMYYDLDVGEFLR